MRCTIRRRRKPHISACTCPTRCIAMADTCLQVDVMSDGSKGTLHAALRAMVDAVGARDVDAELAAMERANEAVDCVTVEALLAVFTQEDAMALYPHTWTVARERLADVDRATEPRAVVFDEYYETVWD